MTFFLNNNDLCVQIVQIIARIWINKHIPKLGILLIVLNKFFLKNIVEKGTCLMIDDDIYEKLRKYQAKLIKKILVLLVILK
jgi:hypothetical protein